MAELGETVDPVALVPGDAARLQESAWEMRTTGEGLAVAAGGLTRLGAPTGWQGRAAEEFRAAFDVVPARWVEAADAHRLAADAVESYAAVLDRAQRRAADAAAGWQHAEAVSVAARDHHAAAPGTGAPFVDPGEVFRREATDLLARIRGAIDLALQASGPDRVAPFRVDQDAEGQGPSTATGSTAEGVRAAGVASDGRRVRQVETEEELRAVYDTLARGATPVEGTSYSGSQVRQPDGSLIGIRDDSLSGGPTIDVKLPNGEKWKVHLPR